MRIKKVLVLMNSSQHPERYRPSPALMIFLILPLIGLIAAIIMFVTNNPQISNTSPTPTSITLSSPKIGADVPAIDFTLTSLNGKTISLSDYNGRIVFLNFWATWCIPCQKELPEFENFQKQQPQDGPTILAINLLENTDQINIFLDEYGISDLTVLLDTDGKVSDDYGIFNLPVTFVIDTSGIVRYVKYGSVTVKDLQDYVTELSAG